MEEMVNHESIGTLGTPVQEVVEEKEQVKEQGKKKNENKKDIAKRINQIKETLAVNPYSVVILPHTEEGHSLSYMTMWADRLIWALRKKAGVIIAPDRLIEHTKNFQRLLEKLYFISGISVSEYNSNLLSEDKFRIAKMRHSWVILPKTSEGRMLAYCTKRIDPLIMQMKATENAESLFAKMQGFISAIIEFNNALEALSKELLTDNLSKREKKYLQYKTPPFVRKAINSGVFQSN